MAKVEWNEMRSCRKYIVEEQTKREKRASNSKREKGKLFQKIIAFNSMLK